MKVIVCGDRHWIGWAAIKRELERLPSDTVIIHGAAKGADTIAGVLGVRMGLEVRVYPAEWEQFGRAAGAIRNKWMLDARPNLVLAFHNDIRRSRGTANMIGIARKKGVEVKLFED
ncbi:hypothetical protein LCGC14_2919710 [marine sediment metagenome]|uniref:YspA cpYpsA-related SLOG domain-containing protein n=1 Tax=marine sediment metagenome TaxID=412755 RepID=A0A0F8YB46_9ZZZZ